MESFLTKTKAQFNYAMPILILTVQNTTYSIYANKGTKNSVNIQYS